jgi:hypothetical protein
MNLEMLSMKYLLMPIALAAAAVCASVPVSAQTVAPPPLPIGAQQVRPEAGLHLEERKRHVRAHHHKMHHKKDYTRDDDDGDDKKDKSGKDDKKDKNDRDDRSGGKK